MLKSGARGAAFCVALVSLFTSCAGSVETIESEEDSDSGGSGGTSATGGVVGSGGESPSGGTGGVYVEPECPDEPPPPVNAECDAFDPLNGCDAGFACYPYLDYPFGEGCGHARYGTECRVASTGEQSDLCGGELGYCSPGYLCVVGSVGGRRCMRICEPVADHGCPDGLICGETDIAGYGVCN